MMNNKYALLNELVEFIFQKCDEAVEEAFNELIDIYEDPDTVHLYNELVQECNLTDYSYLKYCIAIYKEDHQDD